MNISSIKELESFSKAVKHIPSNVFFADAIVDWIQCSIDGKFVGTVLKITKEYNPELYAIVEQELSVRICNALK